jgi:hypothetical protein
VTGTLLQDKVWANDTDKVSDMLVQLRRGRLKFKDLSEDVLMAFMDSMNETVECTSGSWGDYTARERTRALRAACEDAHPQYA